jgi:hypothetical protein
LGYQYRVTGTVINPTGAENCVLGRPDYCVFGALERNSPVGERRVIGHYRRARRIDNYDELDLDPFGTVETEALGIRQHRLGGTQYQARVGRQLLSNSNFEGDSVVL